MLTTYVVRTTATGEAPAAIIGTATNCAAPANTSTDIAEASHHETPEATAIAPKEAPTTAAAAASAATFRRMSGSTVRQIERIDSHAEHLVGVRQGVRAFDAANVVEVT
jgi:hypothetical protein